VELIGSGLHNGVDHRSTDAPVFAGLYYQAGVDENDANLASTTPSSSLDTFYGALSAGGGITLEHQRLLSPVSSFSNNGFDLTFADTYSVASDGTYSASGYKYIVGPGGAVRVGDLPDSSLVSVRLADNRRLFVAAPDYLEQAGTPHHPNDLIRHDCLTLSSGASQTRGWAFLLDDEVSYLRLNGRIDCSDGQVLHDWCLAGLGIAWRSTWEVEREVAAGQLVSVLNEFIAPPQGIYAMFAHAKHLPLRVRLWVDFLKQTYGDAAYWQRAA